MTNKYRKIGILAGMGAAAGVRVLALLVKECQNTGAVKDSDFPEIVFYSLSSNGMDETGVKNEQIIKRDLAEGLRYLNLCDVEIIVIACNSVYQYYDWMQNQSNSPIYNVVYATYYELGRCRKGIVCSQSARENGVWDGLMPTKNQQTQIDIMIEHAIAGEIIDYDICKLNEIINSLIRNGADKVILGCTELPLVLGENMDNDVIDPMEIAIKDILN